MKNVKRILTLLVVLAMVFTCVIALAACQPEDPTKDPSKDPSKDPGTTPPSTDVPVADGKVTLYWTYKGTLPSYGSIWFTGGMTNGFKQRPSEGVLEGQKIEGTDVYYVQTALDQSVNQWNEYALVIGYNASSGLPDGKLGVEWQDSLKSDYCRTFPYPSNATFEWDGKATSINLGEHTWKEANLPEPEEVESVELKITFAKPLGENAQVRIMGVFNDWDTTDGAIATANNDRTVYSITLTDILCTGYDYKVLVCEDATHIKTADFPATDDAAAHKGFADAEGNEVNVWDALYETSYMSKDVDGTAYPVRAFVEINSNGDDMTVNIDKMFEGSYIDLANTVSETIEGTQVKKGIDLSLAVTQEHKSDDVWDGKTFDRKLDQDASEPTVAVTFTITFTTAVEGKFVYLAGDMEGWKGTLMTASADNKTFSVTIEIKEKDLGTGKGFKVVILDSALGNNLWIYPRTEVGGAGVSHRNGDGDPDPGNASVDYTAAGTVNLFADAVALN